MDYYEILGVERSATTEEIGKAYRSLALRFHPDRQPDADTATKASRKFIEVTNAFSTLSDPGKRAAYNYKNPPKIKKKVSRMTEEERYNFIMQHDPNIGLNTIRTASPPKYDIWGKPLSRAEQEEWVRNNTNNIMANDVKKPFVPSKSNFVDVFAKYYEKQSMPHLNRG